MLGDILHVGYTIDPRVQGTVSLVSVRPVPKSDMVFVLENALRLSGVVLLKDTAGYRLTPFVRWETYDTQAEVPSGFASDPANDVEITTFGVAWQPIDRIVLKLDASDVEDDAGGGVDQIHVGLGYIF